MKNNIDKRLNMVVDLKLNQLADNITSLVNETKNHLAQVINTTMVVTYWNIGRYIVEFEQHGDAKAQYGTALLSSLAKILRAKLGKGYSRPNLNNMRKFYLLYPICQTVSDKLSWSHICELITIDDELERSFYEKECIASRWNVRSLRRQMDSALYLRLAASKDKEGILQLAQKGAVIQYPEDVIKDTYTLEFLGLPEKELYKERDLEQRLIDNLQRFLLELGKGTEDIINKCREYGLRSPEFYQEEDFRVVIWRTIEEQDVPKAIQAMIQERSKAFQTMKLNS